MSAYPKVGDVLTAESPEPPVGTVLDRRVVGASDLNAVLAHTPDGWHTAYYDGRPPRTDLLWANLMFRSDATATVLHAPPEPPPYKVGDWRLTQWTKGDSLVARQYGEDGRFRYHPDGLSWTPDVFHWINPKPIPVECLPEVQS